MSFAAVVIPIFTHFVPIVYFVFMLTDVFARNRKKMEHLLASGIILCCLLMFLEEFIRHYLPISYSPVLTAAWFSVAGISITGFGLHLFLKLTHLEHKLPKKIYPAICYLPTVLVLLNLAFNDQMISGNTFHNVGIWKLPVYNTAYYIAMIGSNFFNVLYIIILVTGITRTGEQEKRGIYKQLIFGVLVTAFFNLVIGTIDFKGWLPPYPYIYGSLAWCILLRHTMKQYEFLNHTDSRYEKLFNLSPAAIILTDLQGNVREANPSAHKLFQALGIGSDHIGSILQGELLACIQRKADIKDIALSLTDGDHRVDLLIDGDYVSVEYLPHLILIVRDITAQAVTQRELAFLAYHDSLTKLPNRKYFFEQLNAAIVKAEQADHALALLIFDVDHFKQINDKYGHIAGDQALIQVAECVRATMANDGFAARLAGDEFMMYFPSVVSEEQLKSKIEQLRSLLSEHPLVIGDERIPIQISIGVSLYPEHGTTSDALLNQADKALYRVKQQGRNHYAFARHSD